jgi:uncharacterized membrane protein
MKGESNRTTTKKVMILLYVKVMDRKEFILEIKNKIKHLPYDEIKNALDYYEEYFDEAGEENEQAVIKELGSPSDIASKIISEFAIKDIDKSEKSAKKGMSTIWLVLLGIFASPIALPLAVTFIVLIFVFLIVIASILFSFGITAVAVGFSGVMAFVASLALLSSDYATGIFMLGFSLIAISIGAIFTLLTVSLAKISFNGIAILMAKFLNRRSAK